MKLLYQTDILPIKPCRNSPVFEVIQFRNSYFKGTYVYNHQERCNRIHQFRVPSSVCHCSLHTETLLNDPRPHGSPVLLSSHQIELHHVTSDLCDLTHLKTLLEIRVLFSIFIDFCPSIQVYYICSSHKVQLNARLFIILIIEKRYICSLVFYLWFWWQKER